MWYFNLFSCLKTYFKVLKALIYLCEHNPYYRDVEINRELLGQWPETILTQGLIDRMQVLSDNSEEERARAGPATEEDPIDTDSASPGLNLTGSVIVDVNNHFVSPNVDVLRALRNFKEGAMIKVHTGAEILSENEAPSYFPYAFPCLFPHGHGEHYLPSRARNQLSLRDWARLTLTNSHGFYLLFRF
jgi:hypothetical protein